MRASGEGGHNDGMRGSERGVGRGVAGRGKVRGGKGRQSGGALELEEVGGS
jgi:hypothetical protein